MTKYYRYEDRCYASGDEEYGFHSQCRVELLTFFLDKKTPKGAWIVSEFGAFARRFVRDEGRKRYAYPSLEEARKSFIARKKKQIKIYETRLKYARQALFYIERTIEIENESRLVKKADKVS